MRQLEMSLAAVLACCLGCGGPEPVASESKGSGRVVRDSGVDDDDDDGRDDDGRDDDDDDDDDRTAILPDASTRRPDTGTSEAPPGCGKASFNPQQVLPDMMIVLDSSGSMMTAGVDRWGPSVAALKSLTSTYEKQVGFGLMTFPLANDRCGPGTIQVPIATDMAQEIGQILDRTMPQGGTPTGQSLQRAREWFEDHAAALDTTQGPRYVLLVTDGQPTCPAGAASRVNDEDKNLALNAIGELAELGIKTYVVGYDAQLDPQFATVLGDFAKRGQTERYYPVSDEKSLVEAFQDISTAVRSCSFAFEQAVSDPRYLRVKFDGEMLIMDDPDGWVFQGKNVTLQGAACARLQERASHTVEVTLECSPVL
jgi:Mg-chelatase subunit ChlD